MQTGVPERHVGRQRVLGVLVALALGAAAAGYSSPLLGGASVATDVESVLATPGRAMRAGVDALGRGDGLLADSLLRIQERLRSRQQSVSHSS